MPGNTLMQPGCYKWSRRTGGRRSGLIYLACLVLWSVLLLPGPAGAAAGKISVAASIPPLGDFCRHLGGDLVQVQVLIPPGASPHAFEPAPSVMARASQARVFVYIGAGLEPWAEKLLHAQGPGDQVVVEAARGVPLLGMAGHQHGEGKAEAHPAAGQADPHDSHLSGNPHIWLDPVLAQDICRKISQAFIQVDPGHRAQYEANLQNYLADLEKLNQEIESQSRNWRLRDFVSFHPSFSYFARRYNLHEAGTIEESPGREPTPRHLQDLVASIRRLGIKVVFAEPQLNPRVAEVIAQEAGVKVLTLDPMGGQPPYGDDYLKLMRYNLAELNRALK